MNDTARHDAKTRLTRISGQVAGIGRMVDEDRYCMDILNQIAAVRSALDNLGVQLLTEHLRHCVVGETCEGGEDGHAARSAAHPQARDRSKDELLTEVQTALSRFLR